MYLCAVKPSEQYWEMVAAERKAALTTSLTENKQLHVRNTQLQLEVHSLNDRVQALHDENAVLEEMVSEAKKLAELVAVSCC